MSRRNSAAADFVKVLESALRDGAGGDDRAMAIRPSTVARIGRSYPRRQPEAEAAHPRRLARRYRVMAGLLALISALGLVGWLLAKAATT